MLTHTPQGVSPRFTCHADNYKKIEEAIRTVGHVVIENVFDKSTLDVCTDYTSELFTELDASYRKGEFTEGQLTAYFGNTFSFMSDKKGSEHLDKFMSMLQNSPVLSLYAYLLKGDVAAIHGPMLRRINPKKALRHVGLHPDGQVREYAKKAYNSNDTYTMWTPLCDIDEDTPGLLLIDKRFQVDEHSSNIYNPAANEKLILRDSSKASDISIDISKLYLNNQLQRELSSAEVPGLTDEYYEHTNNLIKKLGPYIYSPKLDKSSIVIFERGLIHVYQQRARLYFQTLCPRNLRSFSC